MAYGLKASSCHPLRFHILGTFGDTNVERKRCTHDIILTLFESSDWKVPVSNVKVTSYVQLSVYVLRSCHQKSLI